MSLKPSRICLVSLGLICGIFAVPQFALTQNVSGQALVVKVCVNNLLFQSIFKDGTPAGPRTNLAPNDAAIACQGVKSLAQALSLKSCVNGLLFTNIFRDGTPAGPATNVDPRSAAIACAICPNSTVSPTKATSF
ncbi:MAG: hypothetical protein KME35_11995 [Aphanocapsa sp. GSE-SYN-MK-11-07L]|nr:hypothetical protein [Aphanocapsa sp. GSE-SYN-MK-11-07L]